MIDCLSEKSYLRVNSEENVTERASLKTVPSNKNVAEADVLSAKSWYQLLKSYGITVSSIFPKTAVKLPATIEQYRDAAWSNELALPVIVPILLRLASYSAHFFQSGA